jgi:hypothetical protein
LSQLVAATFGGQRALSNQRGVGAAQLDVEPGFVTLDHEAFAQLLKGRQMQDGAHARFDVDGRWTGLARNEARERENQRGDQGRAA